MKYWIGMIAALSGWHPATAQLQVTPGSHWVQQGSVQINLWDMSSRQQGNWQAGEARWIFSGNGNSSIQGSGSRLFHNLTMKKTGDGMLQLEQPVSIQNELLFESGLLDLNTQILSLASNARLEGESEQSRVIGPSGGEIQQWTNLNAPQGVNPGNLGVSITSAATLGQTLITRGHTPSGGEGLSAGILRYYAITPAMNTGLQANLEFRYFNAELASQDEALLHAYRSMDAGNSWTRLTPVSVNTQENRLVVSGLSELGRFTLGEWANPNSVSGLRFQARRVNPTSVSLSWRTEQENGHKGFVVERQLDTESSFQYRGYVVSKAVNGISTKPLSYEYPDANNHVGKSSYRLKLESLNGTVNYSEVKVVAGKGGKKVTLTAWPVPARSYFNVMAEGIEDDVLLVMNLEGRVFREIPMQAGKHAVVQGLMPGIYVLKLVRQADVVQKVIVQ